MMIDIYHLSGLISVPGLTDIWHQAKKWLKKPILRKLVAEDAFNATHPLSSLFPTKPLQTFSFYKCRIQEDGDQCELPGGPSRRTR
jgi:hypothetical protein